MRFGPVSVIIAPWIHSLCILRAFVLYRLYSFNRYVGSADLEIAYVDVEVCFDYL